MDCVRSIRLECQNKYFLVWTSSSVNNSGLLTGCEGITEKYRTAVFVQPELARAVLKDQGPVFLSMARANPVNKPFII